MFSCSSLAFCQLRSVLAAGTGRDSIITRSVRPNWASDVPTKKVVCPSSTLTPTLQESRFQQGEGLMMSEEIEGAKMSEEHIAKVSKDPCKGDFINSLYPYRSPSFCSCGIRTFLRTARSHELIARPAGTNRTTLGTGLCRAAPTQAYSPSVNKSSMAAAGLPCQPPCAHSDTARAS